MNAIVSVTREWGIGRDGHLPVRNRADMRRFVRLTMGGTVVMGRKTFETFPGGPLKGRRNIVMTRDDGYRREGVERVASPEEALSLVSAEEPDSVWLIGGASVYNALLPACTRVYVTMNDTSVPADTFFPDLDENPDWVLESEEEGGTTEEGIAFSFRTYRLAKAAE